MNMDNKKEALLTAQFQSNFIINKKSLCLKL